MIKILVKDAENGELIPNFKMISGMIYQATQPPMWFRQQNKVGVDGTLEFPADTLRFGSTGALMIESDGYLPVRYDLPREIRGDLELSLELTKASPIQGIVLGIDGNPLAEAAVMLVDGSSLISIRSPGYSGFLDGVDLLEQHGSGDTSVRTDEEGRFSVNQKLNPTFLVAAHGSGVSFVDATELPDPIVLSLSPWGMIEGTISTKGHDIGARYPIRRTPEMGPFFVEISSSGDEDGYFKISGLPSGPYEVGRVMEKTSATTGQMEMIVDTDVTLKPGQTAIVSLGGKGQPLIGKAVPKGLDIEIDWSSGYHSIETAPSIDVPLIPPNRSDYENDEAFNLAIEELGKVKEAFFTSEEGRQFLANRKKYPVQMNRDGSFRVEAIPSGKYLLNIKPASDIETGAGGTILERFGMGYKEITIPEIEGGFTEEPLDVGVVEVEIFSKLQIGERAPEFEVKTLDDKIIHLSDFRGKYVLLDFWATWCGPCLAELPELKQVYDRFGSNEGFVMIGMSLDDEPEIAKRFSESNDMNWMQAFAGHWGTKVLLDYGVWGIPDAFLISPDGIILHQKLRGSQIYTALLNTLNE